MTINGNEDECEVSTPEGRVACKQRSGKLRTKQASESHSIGNASLASIDEGLAFSLDNNNEESKHKEPNSIELTDKPERCNGSYHGNGDILKTTNSSVFADTDSKLASKKAATVSHLLDLQKKWKSERKKSGKVKNFCSTQGSFKDKWKSLRKSGKMKRFYSRQDSFIEAILEAEKDISQSKVEAAADAEKSNRMVNLAAKVSFFANIILMIAKLTASILSGSMAIISSLVDSVVDLVSGGVIFYTSRAAERTNYYSYPFGRTRLEPAAIIIISVVMGLASFQIIVESIKVSVSHHFL